MSNEILLSNLEAQRWADDGGFVPEEVEEEQRRVDLSILRETLVNHADDPQEAEILLAWVDGDMSASDFARLLKIDRSSGLRRLRTGLRRLTRRLLSDSGLRDKVPDRYRHLLPE